MISSATRQIWRTRILSPIFLSLAVSVLALFLFERLADEMFEGDTRQFDSTVRAFIHSFASPALTWTMKCISNVAAIGPTVALALAITAALYRKNRRHHAVFLALTLVGSVLLMAALKLAFRRARPEPFFGLAVPGDFSFPSGHALVSFCFCGVLAYGVGHHRSPSIRIVVWSLASLFVLLVGVSRIYLGVHYPSDVVAGYLGGTVWILGMSLAYRRWERRDAAARGSSS